MANPEHLDLLRQGVGVWNEWRSSHWRKMGPRVRPYLYEADLSGANLVDANLSETELTGANLSVANLTGANFGGANLWKAKLTKSNLHKANLSSAGLTVADLSGANLSEARLIAADLDRANLSGADLRGANLISSTLRNANLSGANLSGANLSETSLVKTDLVDATLTDCRIYGISAWDVTLTGTKQQGLIITPEGEPAVAVDDLEVAQFVYLLLHNEKIRRVIDTIGRKGVLLLGRFTEGRMVVLERLREELRKRGYLPIVFNFDKPETKDFTETVRVLAGLSHFVIADVTNPRSAPLELQATVPDIKVPFRPIIEKGEEPFTMLADLLQYDWVFQPIRYSSLDTLIGVLDEKIIAPAKAKFAELLARKAEGMKVEDV
jgi:hypothetical protein